jgi:hypothetical protein
MRLSSRAYRDVWNKLLELSERTASLHPGALGANPVIEQGGWYDIKTILKGGLRRFGV